MLMGYYNPVMVGKGGGPKHYGMMKSILFLFLIASASAALPPAIVLPAGEIYARESAWVKANPSGFALAMTTRADCGAGNSMRPMMKPNDRLYFEAYAGQKLKGSVALVSVPYCKLPIAHLVYDETETHVFLTGINNSRSDGWQPKFGADGKPLVLGVLVGIIRPEK